LVLLQKKICSDAARSHERTICSYAARSHERTICSYAARSHERTIELLMFKLKHNLISASPTNLHKLYQNLFTMWAAIAQSVWRVATGWKVRRSIPGGARFYAAAQTVPEAHPAFYTMGKAAEAWR
jgi:hypothetical protein